MAKIRGHGLLDQYFFEISKSTGLAREQEVKLAERIREGDEESFRILVEANLRFVVSVAKQYQHSGLPLSDLINEGNFGLAVAARRFDGSRGWKFISYAVWWIRQAILVAIAEQSRIVRVPLNRIGELIWLNKIIAKMEQELGRPPELDEISKELAVNSTSMYELAQLTQRPASLDARLDQDKDAQTLGDLLPDPFALDIDEAISSRQLRDEVTCALTSLGDNEARVLSLYFGLNGHAPMTLEAIGSLMGRTRERVRQIKEKALHKLRAPSRSGKLREIHENLS